MSKRIKISHEGRDVEAERVEVVSSQEQRSTYNLSDGTTLSLRTIVIDVLRLVDVWNDDGDPVYVVRSSPTLSADVPLELRKRG
jgi:hypothetical protein